MIVRAASGWQTITADLALILFLATAQAAGHEPKPIEPPESRQAYGPPNTSALAVHRPKAGEPVREWLAANVTDGRQLATISVDYTPGNRVEALTEGARILEEAEAAGVPARLVMAPAGADAVLISIDYLRMGEDGTNLAP